MNQPVQPVLDLAQLALAGMTGGESRVRVGVPLASLAIGPHGLGPLLWRAVEGGASAEPEASAMLARADAINRLRIAATVRASNEIGGVLAGAGIAALAIKGSGLAGRLYADPASRNSGDLDLLVSPDHWLQAARLLAGRSWQPCHVSVGVDDRLFGLAQGRLKDLKFVHPGGTVSVELHRRLFFGPIESRTPGIAAIFTPRPFTPGEAIPVPPMGAGLALYLLLHGAVSRWRTLKHLVDLVPLLRTLSPAELIQTADWAEQSATAPSVKAGLLLFASLFGAERLGPLGPWTAERAGTSAVAIRLARYVEALNGDAALHRARASRLALLAPDLQLVDTGLWRTSILGRAALSSAMRLLAAAAARRLPGGAIA
jgi:hypothetical protein